MTKTEEAILKTQKALHLARRDVLKFTEYTKSDYDVGWHHRNLADKLNAFARGEIRFLMVFMPPRHGKSELVSRRFPAFLHGLYPDVEIMAASYNDSLAGEMTTAVQNIIDSPEYREIFPNTTILPSGVSYAKGKRNSEEHSIIGHRGKYRGQGVGGSFTGKGANFVIIDDPIKGREIADSVAFRDRLWNFYLNDLYSRLETDLKSGRRGQVLITQTRWHEDDLSGRLLELMKADPNATQWEILNYPAIKVDSSDPTDIRQLGEPLWPKKYDLEALNQIKATAGLRAWSSLYQQNPKQEGGALFNEAMFTFGKLPEEFDYTYITADTSYKEKQENDFTVFTAFGVRGDQLYVMDCWRRQVKSSDVEVMLEPWIRRFLYYYSFRGTYIEPKGHGIYLNQKWQQSGLGIPSEDTIKEFYADRRLDKVERANNAVPHLTNRTIIINKDIAIKEELVSECLGFPKGKHDDFVDTLIDGIKMCYSRTPSILDACG